ncbi:hypothetical protein TTHERM_01513250 (macronuclear) [Tetrahymena thermophila SB210]|uniref:BTB/POZ domain protein n=1 Tax=Tetrahymena thermophila (strain SB210) TaxID=312017 RepID=Q24JG2_TETTS|nr:hypothetical protein TTHERM_01513250 [Tetrahymena thermophila SB210]EAS07914.1 hypothetical protein TTHERM_01513250 [Tetrahymena thermophila SB210]|eukprot:XP_001028156.1 hypothetical protein TTHERM_01513250 [Tetrahymena thermophila SB210]
MEQPQQQQQLPLGEPQIDNLTYIFSQYSQTYYQSAAGQFNKKCSIQLNVSNMNTISIQSFKQLDQNMLILQQPRQDVQSLIIIYGNQKKQVILNKTYLIEEFLGSIPYDSFDLSLYSPNILEEDFENFINFLFYGVLQFPSTKVPTYICLLTLFQMHIYLRDITQQLLNSFNNQQCNLFSTQNYDDILLYHLFEYHTYNKPSYCGFMNLMLNQQWILITQKVSWFSSQNGQYFEISALLKLFNEDQFKTFLNSLYFYERIYYFNYQKCLPNCSSDALYVIVGLNQIINEYYNSKKIADPHDRTQQVQSLLNQYLPLEKNINMGLFKEIKDFYNQKFVNEILISQVENLQKQVEELKDQKLACVFTSKLSLWQLKNHQL